jgi:hypothetical protein
MASFIQAFSRNGPRIDLGKAIKPEQFRNRIVEISRQPRALVINIQVSEADALLELLLHGYPVHTEIAIFTPCIDLEGNLKVSVRMNKSILSRLNAPGAFQGKVINRRNIGKPPRKSLPSGGNRTRIPQTDRVPGTNTRDQSSPDLHTSRFDHGRAGFFNFLPSLHPAGRVKPSK